MAERVDINYRVDRLVHAVARIVWAVAALPLVPLWLLARRLRGVARALWSHDADSRVAGAARVTATPLAPADLKAAIERIPQNPRKWIRGPLANAIKGLPDLVPFMLTQGRRWSDMGYEYPRPFKTRVVNGADGVPVAMALAKHGDRRPALIVVHGVFSTRRFDYVRQTAVPAFFEWGYDVAAIDLRGFGLTGALSDACSSGGWKEGQDILEVARELKRLGSTTVGVLGISLGASAALNACSLEGADTLLDGGVLAVGGPADTEMAASRLMSDGVVKQAGAVERILFREMLRAKHQSMDWSGGFEDFRDPVREVFAPFYGIDEAEYWERSSAKNTIAGAKTPTMILHAEDDTIVSVEHARILDDAARDNELVQVVTIEWGSHAAFDVLDRPWAFTVYRMVFDNLARWETASVAGERNGRVESVVNWGGTADGATCARP